MKHRPWRDPAPLLLSLLGLLGGGSGAFLRLAPNRLLSGQALAPWQLAPGWLAPLLLLAWAALLASSWMPARRGPRVWDALWASLLLLGLPSLAGLAAARLLEQAPAPTLARVQLGSGFWLMWMAAALLLLDRLRLLRLGRWTHAGWLLALLLGLLGTAASGGYRALALSQEYLIQRGAFGQAVLSHLLLVLAALTLALLLGAPLAWLTHRRPRWQRWLLGLLNLLQTLPSIALFALLLGPLALLARHWPALGTLGIGGTGAAPAVIALWLYALLPVARGVLSGLDGVPVAALEAARGMGMSRAQQLWRVQLPLAWPVLLAGLRIVVVQSIGLATVAALIGAGGLGRFVFLGLGQGATDLVMLGTLAIIALALSADALFQGLQALTESSR